MSTTSARLLSLLAVMHVRRDWPGQLLADRLAVSARTVRRDVDRLRELGYPIEAIKGPDGGYRLAAGTDLPPLLFDDDQAIALAIALQMATANDAVGESAARALATVRQVMPSRLRHKVDALKITTATSADQQQVSMQTIVELGDAIRANELTRFVYEGSDKKRLVEPHHLVTRNGRWYLIAWDVDREDWRTFRADRISKIVQTGRRFAARELPGGNASTFINARFKGSVDEDVWPCNGEVVMRIAAAEIAPFVNDGTVEAIDDSRSRVTVGAWSWEGLAANFARFDADFESVEPKELRDAFSKLAQRFQL